MGEPVNLFPIIVAFAGSGRFCCHLHRRLSGVFGGFSALCHIAFVYLTACVMIFSLLGWLVGHLL